MTIILNGKPHQANASTLEELCRSLGYPATGIATAVNGDFIPAHQRSTAILKPGDAIEVVSPREGG